MSDVLNVLVRSEVGSNAVKSVRKSGNIPAVLYGHGLENVNLSIPADDVEAAIQAGSQMVTLKGGISDTALVSDVQWDAFGKEILHLDLTRVSAEEKVQVTVPLTTRGEAAGIKQGGNLEVMAHEILIECSAASIPDKIEIRVHDMQIGDSLKAGELPLPPGTVLCTNADDLIVQCVEVREEEEVELGESAEPEVIGRKDEEEEAQA
jgi:large subunit ribosomal protein L25